nr:hypothetical protein [Tanacetum cinerariifolium]
MMLSVNESEEDNNQANDRYKAGEGYHADPPLYTGNFTPLRPDLSFAGLADSIFKSAISETITSVHETETSTFKTSKESMEKPKTVRPSAPIIEDWEFDSDDDYENTRKSVIESHTYKQAKNLRNSQNSRVDKRDWNGMMTQKLRDGFEFKKKSCFVCGSLYHLIKDCKFYENKMVGKSVLNNMGKATSQREVRPVWNNAKRVNHQNFSNNLTHPHPRRNFVPTAVITNLGKVPVNTAKHSSPRATTSTNIARYVNTAATRPTVNGVKPSSNVFHKSHSPVRRTFNQRIASQNSVLKEKINTAKVQEIFNSGCSRHMTENKSFLTDYLKINGGFVAFGGSPKGELKFNLFTVSQMCDKKNNVLFTETECLVLSPDFKLPDENQVSLKVPRQNNMYSFDLKNVVPLGGLTCLFVNATIDESNLWHRRLGHINFKTMNKLMKRIKREFSVSRTPQQNRVAERKNRTLIEAARTMLADSLLPTTFWAKAVSTACYVQNRVLVTKPHNKTLYELLIGRSPNLYFMKPFWYPITILNTLDHLGKFERKVDEGFLVGYSVNSKAFRVFNSRTRRVEENLHIKFLENKTNVVRRGLDWLFDIDSRINSMNYEPVTSGNQSNNDAGIEINANAGKDRHEKASNHEYILLSFMPSSTQSSNDKDAGKVPDKGDEGVSKGSSINDQEKTDSSTQDVDTADPSINTASTNINTGSLNINIVGSNDPSMTSLEEISIFDDVYDHKEVGAEADTNNLELLTVVSLIPTTRVHKNHPKKQIIGELNLTTQTRRMLNFSKENAMVKVSIARQTLVLLGES